ncbi:glycoside hydrolase family 76 protein [Thozetella sp. PMI_491]|nr:glycoside hydrolase family 76 protein [Thozetella sp. PMI_491]
MSFWSVRSLFSVLGFAGLQLGANALQSADPSTLFNSFNNALLVQSGTDVYYKAALNTGDKDTGWSAALNILAAEDVYDRTGNAANKKLVNDLLTTWLRYNSPPWTSNWWNDDLGWYTLALIRGYQITGTQTFLDNAKYGFDLAFARGWDTQYNDGGIWELNPEGWTSDQPPVHKEALSTDSLGKVACLLYQATHDSGYLARCTQIYNWARSHLYNANTGQIYTGIEKDGTLNTASAVYNQGTFLDFATIVYEITGDANVRADAQRAIDFGRNSQTVNGIFSNSNTGLNTWADEMARGVGRYVRNHQLWNNYYDWMVQNADAIMSNRRSDLGITDNGWNRPTPMVSQKANAFASAVSWLQNTPVTKPTGAISGLRYIINQKTGLAIDNEGTFGDGNRVIQWHSQGNQNQRWSITPNSDDGTWNIISLSSFKVLDCPNGGTDDGLGIIQWRPTRNSNQRWLITQQSDGTYQIKNQASGKVLDGASATQDGAILEQWTWNGGSQQRWILSAV